MELQGKELQESIRRVLDNWPPVTTQETAAGPILFFSRGYIFINDDEQLVFAKTNDGWRASASFADFDEGMAYDWMHRLLQLYERRAPHLKGISG